MRRRTLFGLTASAGALGVLGAGVKITEQPSVPPATHADELVPPVGERKSPVVTADTTTAGHETYGTVRQDASVLDLESPSRYALVTQYRLIPGSNYNAGTEWKTDSLTVEHRWRSGSLVSHSGDVVSTDTGDADSNLYLHTDRSTGRYRWQLTFEDAIGDARTYRFATVINRAQNPTAGTVLVDATFGGGFTKGFLRRSERDFATARLVMQRPHE